MTTVEEHFAIYLRSPYECSMLLYILLTNIWDMHCISFPWVSYLGGGAGDGGTRTRPLP